MLKQIQRPIEVHLHDFEAYFRHRMSTRIGVLNAINNYVVRRKGKLLRPMLVFLSAGLNGRIDEASYVAAGMIEMLHTATLIHDDVVDEAYQRRGFLSINALWRSKAAVLVGDFMLAQGLNVAVEHSRMDMLRVINNAVQAMSEGELLQLERARHLNLDEPTYYDIIGMKTAALFSACCQNGALAAGASPDRVALMGQVGQQLGIAFQMRDDLFDYQPHGLLGKPTGNDIKERKLTLPLIYALRQAPPPERRRAMALLRRADSPQADVAALVHFAQQHGGLDYAEQQMRGFARQAVELLAQMPRSDYRQSLELLCQFVVERKK